MSIREIAEDLVRLCREGKNVEAIQKHYHEDAISLEPIAPPDGSRESVGRDAILGKNQWWLENHGIHGGEIRGPFVDTDQFALYFRFDVTYRPTGQRRQMTEMGLYTVENDKVVREEFFYHADF